MNRHDKISSSHVTFFIEKLGGGQGTWGTTTIK